MTSVTSIAAPVGALTAPTGRERAEAPASAAGPAFEAALGEVGSASSSAADFRHQTSRSGELKPEQAFESFVLRSFIEEMLPKENTAVFGGGTAGNIWRSMLAERIADEMAAGGGIGIAETISRDASAKAD